MALLILLQHGVIHAKALLMENVQAVEEEVMTVDSGLAEYNGKEISLSGSVVIKHELGRIAANKVVLTPETVQKKVRFKFLKMEGEVAIALKDGGQLCCAFAELDYQAMNGNFLGDAQQEYVVYTECSAGKGVGFIPLILKSHHMQIQIARTEAAGTQSARSNISEISADGIVSVHYNKNFIAEADLATYRRLPIPQSMPQPLNASNMPGLISLYGNPDNGLCQVTNSNGGFIKAVQISIDTVNRRLLFVSPNGAISHLGENGLDERIDFSCDTLLWEDALDVLMLRKNIIVTQKGIGKLAASQEVKLFQHMVDNSKRFCSMESLGQTILTYGNEEKAHVITCYGKLVVDHERLQTLMDSPRNAKGAVIEGKQVFFQDSMGEVYADKLRLEYKVVEGELFLVVLILEGNVQILNRCAVDPQKKEAFLQYALADKVTYTAEAKEMSLSAVNKRRVLFFDKLNNIQVSAPALKIRRDQATKKESIQGFGDVRFSFLEQESKKMQKKFQFGESLKEAVKEDW